MRKSIFILIYVFLLLSGIVADVVYPPNTVVENASVSLFPTLDLSSYSYVRIGFYDDADRSNVVDYLFLKPVTEEGKVYGEGSVYVYYDIIANEAVDVKLQADGPLMGGLEELGWNIYRGEELITGSDSATPYDAGVIAEFRAADFPHGTDIIPISLRTEEVTKSNSYEASLRVFIESVGAGV